MDVERRQSAALRIVVLAASFCAATVFAALIPLFWHDKLYIDGLTIVQTHPVLEPFGSSFASSAYLLAPILWVMRLLGLQLDSYGLLLNDDLLIVNSLFGGLFFLGIGLFAWAWRLRGTARNLLVFSAFVVLFAPFYFCITKELVLFAVTFLALAAYRLELLGVTGMAWFYALALVLCGVYFRVYYIAFALLLLFNFVLWRRRRWLLLGYLAGVVLLIAWHDALPLDLINKGRATYLENVSASRIEYYFDDASGLGFVANRAVTLAMLLLPLNLLLVSVSYAPFVAVQLYLTARMVGELHRPRSGLHILAGSAVLAFTAVSALYEPDFGSYFRHKVGVMLFMLLLVTDYDWQRHGG